VSMWVKVMAGSTSWRNVFFYGADDDWTNWEARKNNNPLIDRTPGFWIYPDNTTRLHYRHRALTDGGFNDGIDVTDTAVLPPFGAWFHYSTTINGNQAKSYINGKLVVSRTLPGNFEWNDMKPKKLRLGKDGISAGVYLQKFYWYNRVLTDAEISQLAQEVKEPIVPTNVCIDNNVCIDQPELKKLKSIINDTVPSVPLRVSSMLFEAANNKWAIQPESGVAFVIRDIVSSGDKRHALWKNKYVDK